MDIFEAVKIGPDTNNRYHIKVGKRSGPMAKCSPSILGHGSPSGPPSEQVELEERNSVVHSVMTSFKIFHIWVQGAISCSRGILPSSQSSFPPALAVLFLKTTSKSGSKFKEQNA